MWLLLRLQGFVILGVIAAMLALGLGITLKSGVVSLTNGQGIRQVVSNLYQTILGLLAFLASLAVINQWVGVDSALLW